MINQRREKGVAGLLLAGIITFLVAGLATLLLAIGGMGLVVMIGKPTLDLLSALGVLTMSSGLIMVMVGLFVSVRAGRVLAKDTTLREIEGAHIQARFAVDREHALHFPIEHIEEADLAYWVRVVSPNHETFEFKTAPEVYFQCGEGMKGLIRYQGDWLSTFVPVNKPGAEGLAADPFLRP